MMTDNRMRRRGVAATITFFAAVLALVWAGVVLLSGGLAAGILVARNPVRPLIASAMLAALARVLSPADVDAALARMVGGPAQWPARIALVAAGAVWVIGAAWNTRAVGGSDSSCYVLQADAFAHGHARLRNPLAAVLTDVAPAAFAPTGFVPSAVNPRDAVPICSPGLSLLMAPLVPLGQAAFLVVPFCAALAVYLSFVLGRRLYGAWAGAGAAVLVATLPPFVYQSIQPMSDVPAATFLIAAMAALTQRNARGHRLGGMCLSIAVLVRINLLLPAIALLLLLRDRRALARTLAAAAPAVTLLVVLNLHRYGAPFASGYGPAGSLFAASHVAPNFVRYLSWTMRTASPLVLAAVVAPWTLPDGDARRCAAVILVTSVFVIATYLPYTVFDDWWYLRFLLPALLPLIVLATGGIAALAERMGARWAAVGVVIVVSLWQVRLVQTLRVLDLARLESRYRIAGQVARRLPPNAVCLTVQESGAIWFYARIPTLGWGDFTAASLDVAFTHLRERGYHPLVVLEDAEVEPFRMRFSDSAVGALDWPPFLVVDASPRVAFFDPVDRERFEAGSRIRTDHVR
jgi:hypothetical protein